MKLDVEMLGLIDRRGINECWPTYDRQWYKNIRRKNKVQGLHRLIWECWNEDKIGVKECICHSCDNPGCYNPFHLWKGTQSDNMRDMSAKRKYPGRKLNRQQVNRIRKTVNQKMRGIAKSFDVSFATVRDIVIRRTWK
jgi:hypothetical protein